MENIFYNVPYNGIKFELLCIILHFMEKFGTIFGKVSNYSALFSTFIVQIYD